MRSKNRYNVSKKKRTEMEGYKVIDREGCRRLRLQKWKRLGKGNVYNMVVGDWSGVKAKPLVRM